MKKRQKSEVSTKLLKLVDDTDPVPKAPVYLSVTTAARLLDMSGPALRKRIIRGEVPPGIVTRVGGRTLRLHRIRYLDWLNSLVPGPDKDRGGRTCVSG